MLTNDDLYKRYGEDIVFLFKGQEPFVEALGAPAGVLIERDDKVLCYECEEWFPQLQYHLRKDHKMKTDDYKEKYGFNRLAPLCSRKMSQERSELAYVQIQKDPSISRKVAAGRKRALQVITGRGYEKRQPKKRMQAANTRNTCPAQIEQRYRLLQATYGKDVSLNQIRQVDSGVEMWAVRHYGSWNNFKSAIGETIDTSSYAKEVGPLVYDLREYVGKYAKLPWDPYTKERLNKFPHSQTPYVKRFGKISNALLAAGITSEYEVIDGKSRKVFEVGYSIDERYMWEAERSLKRLSARAMPKLAYLEA